MGAQEPDVADRLRELIDGHKVSRALYAVVQLGVPDLLDAGPRPVGELASRSGAHEDALLRVLRLLASHGLFEELEGGRFALTSISRPLRSGAPGSERLRVLMNGADWYFEPWRALPSTLRDGETGVRHVYGEGFFEHLDRHPAERELFDRAMAETTSQDVGALLDAYDFSRFRSVVDVGGGEGALSEALLDRCPELSVVLLESERGAARAERRLTEAGLSGRARAVRGDFFQAIPPGGDAYVLKDILHDWNDEASSLLLRRCREAMSEDSVLLVLERLADDSRARAVRSVDVTMLVLTGGRERTAAEYRALLHGAGLELARVVPTRSVTSVLEARPR